MCFVIYLATMYLVSIPPRTGVHPFLSSFCPLSSERWSEHEHHDDDVDEKGEAGRNRYICNPCVCTPYVRIEVLAA